MNIIGHIYRAMCLAIIFVLFTSCIGTRDKVIDTTLLPAMRLAWGGEVYGLQADVLRGIDDAHEDGDIDNPDPMRTLVDEMSAALDSGNLSSTPWPALASFAERGIRDRIDDGEITAAVARELRLRVQRFEDALQASIAPTTTGRVERPQRVFIVKSPPNF
jgi:hypothetical protein